MEKLLSEETNTLSARLRTSRISDSRTSRLPDFRIETII